MLNPLERKIADIVTPVVEDQGLELVCVQMHSNILQITAEDPATKSLNIDACASLSREISALLEVEDPIKGAFKLEVSSPGIDRLLVKVQDFANFKGHEAKIELDPPLEGQKKFRGVLKGVEDGENIILDTDMGEYAIPYTQIKKAKLILTDKLIKQTKRN